MSKQVNIREQLAQMAIDIPELQPYFHSEIADRKPLKMLSGPHTDAAWKLTKFGAPVVIVAQGDAKKSPLLEITRFDLDADSADVEMKYAIEGILVNAQFNKNSSGDWKLKTHKLVER